MNYTIDILLLIVGLGIMILILYFFADVATDATNERKLVCEKNDMLYRGDGVCVDNKGVLYNVETLRLLSSEK